MEKAVAKRFQYDIVKEDLIHTNQFSGRTHLLIPKPPTSRVRRPRVLEFGKDEGYRHKPTH
jgi:hypothetical protein